MVSWSFNLGASEDARHLNILDTLVYSMFRPLWLVGRLIWAHLKMLSTRPTNQEGYYDTNWV